jgi:hypothetical protein
LSLKMDAEDTVMEVGDRIDTHDVFQQNSFYTQETSQSGIIQHDVVSNLEGICVSQRRSLSKHLAVYIIPSYLYLSQTSPFHSRLSIRRSV